ncbi:MAG: phosphotransferase [Candidatus Lokiarchaeota archaeon]|nr:phosphotransferase [Candidatus Lokiarchaeota archaeon]
MAKRLKVKLETKLLLPKQRKALQEAADELYNMMQNGEGNFISKIWPTFNENITTPSLHIETLNRLGGEPGRTGNLVLAGRFVSTKYKDMLPSRPMIIKISPEPGMEGASKSRKWLLDEYKASENLYDQFSDSAHFALPVWVHGKEGGRNPVVLWAPLESRNPPYGNIRLQQAVDFMTSSSRLYFEDEREKILYRIISVTENLFEAHCVRNKTHREEVNIINHYEWELRKTLKHVVWVKAWKNLWGNKEKVVDFDRKDWPNPFFICKKLYEKVSFPLRMGHIHGDLHPRNIVFSKDETPRIIDFGWARPVKRGDSLQHIIKDFVLLEANFRFMTLPPFLAYESMKHFNKWLSIENDPVLTGDRECDLRMNLIYRLRNIAKQHVGDSTNWDVEYIVPLFLVSFGLLTKHSCNADCSWAARYTVLSLADYIKEKNIV